MRALVTGGAGFIGSHLVRALLARGDRVRVLDDFSSGTEARLASLGGSLDIIRGDVRDAASVARAVAGTDLVVHLAAQVSVPRSVVEPLFTADVNVLGTLRVLEACRAAGASRFVLASSCAVYGDQPPPLRESALPMPLSPYAASKLAGESFVAAAAHGGLGAISLRFFNVYGAGQDAHSAYAAALPAFAAAVAAGRAPRLFGDGLQERDLIHVDEVVRAILLALEAPPEAVGHAFNVGTGRAITMLELARRVGEVLGQSVTPSHEPARSGDIRFSLADTTRARDLLGFEDRIDLVEGLRRTLH